MRGMGQLPSYATAKGVVFTTLVIKTLVVTANITQFVQLLITVGTYLRTCILYDLLCNCGTSLSWPVSDSHGYTC